MLPTSLNPESSRLLGLLQLASPSLPVGAYSYSEGLEYAVYAGAVKDVVDLRGWIEDGLLAGTAKLEAAVLARVYRERRHGDRKLVAHWDAWLTVTRESEELRAQSHDMGRALLRLLRDLEPGLPDADRFLARPCNFATAFALAGVHWTIPCEQAVMGYLQSAAANLVGAGVKLIPLGQTAGQQLLWDLHATIVQATHAALTVSDEDLGVGNWGLALASMAHETQYTRLFRS